MEVDKDIYLKKVELVCEKVLKVEIYKQDDLKKKDDFYYFVFYNFYFDYY